MNYVLSVFLIVCAYWVGACSNVDEIGIPMILIAWISGFLFNKKKSKKRKKIED